jgi:hypothetical protein
MKWEAGKKSLRLYLIVFALARLTMKNMDSNTIRITRANFLFPFIDTSSF